MCGAEIDGYRVLRADSVAIPNAIAAVLLYIRDVTGKRPHVYFGWMEGNPLKHLAKYMLLGEGDIAPVTHEVLRQAEPDPTGLPAIHVGLPSCDDRPGESTHQRQGSPFYHRVLLDKVAFS